MEFSIEIVASQLGVAASTIERWYRWKRRNANHPLAELLPEPTKQNKRRKWTTEDLDKLMLFQASIPKGPGGLFAELTYKRKEK